MLAQLINRNPEVARVNNILKSASDPRTAVYNRGHELGYSDAQINEFVSALQSKLSGLI